MLAAGVLGCGSGGQPDSADSKPSPESAVKTAGTRTVTINGRSVAYNWMSYWGDTGSGRIRKNACTFEYKELDADNIASSFAGNVAGLVPGSVVFFKFCFVDFDGSNLARREGELEQVIGTARAKGLKLVVGNALPVRAQDGNARIVNEEKKFNEFLAGKADAGPNIWVLDMNGVLAGPDGYLKPGYDTGDSHPNNTAYAALDQVLFPLLDNAFAGTH